MKENRNIKIIRFINEFGFCELPQIQKQFGLNKSNAYKVMQRLIKDGYVMHERIFYHRHGVYRVTRNGASVSGLPMLSQVSVGNYEHQIAVIEIYIKLMRQYPDASWLTERMIRRTGDMPGKGRDKHYADALMILSDGRQIAIEVELTMKSKNRLKDIMMDYMILFDIKEVWYFCAPAIVDKVRNIAENWKTTFKVFELEPDITDKMISVSSDSKLSAS